MALKDLSKEKSQLGFCRLRRPPLRSVGIGYKPALITAGANVPVWILCRIIGLLVSLSLRPLFITIGIGDWMTPRPFIYSCVALIVAFLCWRLAVR